MRSRLAFLCRALPSAGVLVRALGAAAAIGAPALAAAQARLSVASVSPNPASTGATVGVNGAGFDAPTLIVVLRNNDPHATMSSYSMRRYLGALSASHFEFPLTSAYYTVPAGSYTLHIETMDANGARSYGQADVPVSVRAGGVTPPPVATAPVPAPRRAPTPNVQYSQHMAILTDDGRCLYGSASAMGAGACDMSSAVFTAVYNPANYFTISHNDGTCVTAGTAAGQPATLSACRAAGPQRFYFNPTGQMQVAGGNLCLDLSGGQRNVSYKLVTWTCDLNPNQAARAWNQRFVMALLAPAQPLRAAGVPLPSTFNPAVSLTAGSIGTGARVIAAGGANVINAGGANLIGNAGGTIIAAGGGNVINAGGANVINAGGANVIAAGGGNVIAVTGLLPLSGQR